MYGPWYLLGFQTEDTDKKNPTHKTTKAPPQKHTQVYTHTRFASWESHLIMSEHKVSPASLSSSLNRTPIIPSPSSMFKGNDLSNTVEIHSHQVFCWYEFLAVYFSTGFSSCCSVALTSRRLILNFSSKQRKWLPSSRVGKEVLEKCIWQPAAVVPVHTTDYWGENKNYFMNDILNTSEQEDCRSHSWKSEVGGHRRLDLLNCWNKSVPKRERE